MKKLIIFCLFILFSALAFGQTSLTVTVKNIREPKGSIRVGLYNKEEDFLKKVYQGKSVKAVGSEITVIFDNLPEGEYAISVVHDENENEKLDSNKIGIPKEGYCFGNNALGKFGPPSYDKVKIKLGATPVAQSLTMKYLLGQS
ncbi:MAG TPA: DUF2141 domain-containing protein [Cyclobacteriaceae bacterium]